MISFSVGLDLPDYCVIGIVLPCDGVSSAWWPLQLYLSLVACIQVLLWPFVGALLQLCDELGLGCVA